MNMIHKNCFSKIIIFTYKLFYIFISLFCCNNFIRNQLILLRYYLLTNFFHLFLILRVIQQLYFQFSTQFCRTIFFFLEFTLHEMSTKVIFTRSNFICLCFASSKDGVPNSIQQLNSGTHGLERGLMVMVLVCLITSSTCGEIGEVLWVKTLV